MYKGIGGYEDEGEGGKNNIREKIILFSLILPSSPTLTLIHNNVFSNITLHPHPHI
jgi:hypothetical protein